MEIVKKSITVLRVNPVYGRHNSQENTSLPLDPTAPSTIQNLHIVNESREDGEVVFTDLRLLQMWGFYEYTYPSYMTGKYIAPAG